MTGKKVNEKDLAKFQKYYDSTLAFKLLKKLRKATRDKPPVVAGSAGAIVGTLGHLLSALENPATPLPLKALIMGCIGYIIYPFDLILDFLPIVGYADDFATAAGVLALCIGYSKFTMKDLDAEIDGELKKA
ncbi:MAG: DUF1232 domain-containing protein [Spirochaetaceae bacterium]|nr:DUF1232 domain-containing protein [Spirochaetaceae bacterium]